MMRSTASRLRICSRVRASIRPSWPRPGSTSAGKIGGLDNIGALAADREGRAARLAQRGRPHRHPSGGADGRSRAHLLHQRHHRHAELYPAHRQRRRELGAHLGAQLRRLGREERATDRHHLQRRPFRGRRRARLVRARRPLPHSNRHRQHRAPDGGGDAAQAAGHRVHTLLRAAPCRVGQAT